MKSKKICITLIFTFLLILCGITKVDAKSQHLNNLNFEAHINNDGTMVVTETWNIKVTNTNTLYKSFKNDSNRYSGITDVKVEEVDTNGNTIPFTKSNSWAYHVETGHYYGTENEDGNFEIGWGTGLEHSKAIKTYKISYKVLDAIAKYDDYAELYWQFLGDDFQIDADKITGIIYLPTSAESKDDIRVWGHTKGLNGTVYVKSKNEIVFQLNKYKKGNFVEIRTLFPRDMIYSTARTRHTNVLNSVLSEERIFADEANQRRKNGGRTDEEQEEFLLIVLVISIIVMIIVSIVIIATIIAQKKKKKAFQKFSAIKLENKMVPSMQFKYFRDIPDENMTPFEVIKLQKIESSILETEDFSNAFSATLLDFCLKGYLKIQPIEKDVIYIYLLKTADINLKEDETKIINFLQEAFGTNDKITLHQLQSYMQNHSSKVQDLIENVSKISNNELGTDQILKLDNYEIYKEYSKVVGKASPLVITIMVICFIGMLSGNFLAFIISAIIAFITGKIQMNISSKKKKMTVEDADVLTQKGVDLKAEWNGLKNFMNDLSMIDKKEIPELVLWEKYLVFATAMGIADKVIKQLKIIYPNFEQELNMDGNTYMYIMMNDNSFSSGSFTNIISSSIYSSMSSAYSSATGSGGGFSGGGGGGRRPEEAAVEDNTPQIFL